MAPGPKDETKEITLGHEHRARREIRISGPSMPYDPSYHWMLRVDKIRELIEAERPDVLEVHSPYFAALSAALTPSSARGITTFFWHSNHLDTYVRPWLVPKLGIRTTENLLAPVWRFTGALLRRCEAVFTASRGEFATLRGHGVNSSHCVPFGVDTKIFTPTRRSGQAPSSPLRLVGAGRLAFEKRWDVVIEAVKRVSKQVAVEFTLVGDGPERPRLQAMAKEASNIAIAQFTSDRGELAGRFASADIYVHACPYETFGLTVAEAVACGTPVVVPNHGGAQESVAPGASETYRALDPEDCARAIVRLAKRHDAWSIARAHALGVRSVYDHIQDVLAVYESCLNS